MKKDIFISYSSLDSSLVEQLADDLRGLKINVWLDKWDIELGANVTEDINKGLEQSRFLLVVITKNSLESRWVKEEWTNKYNEEIKSDRIMVIPLIADEISDDELPILLRGKQRLNLIDGYDLKEIERLAEYISNKRGEEIQKALLAELENDSSEFELDDIDIDSKLNIEGPFKKCVRLLPAKVERAAGYSTDRKVELILRDLDFAYKQLKKADKENLKRVQNPSSEEEFILSLLNKPDSLKAANELVEKLNYIKESSTNLEHCLEDLLLEMESWLVEQQSESK